ncbi:hypothetical protein OKA05_14895 [Luteolibacter arcticus]|uniref:Verru_Chthon cassette protein A n=1 Tax=Luteolibacter arcticus TaxID=1581411 RepID=A0ABT3GK03_9BACT|nr:hypothetical protein [Luteolibacter arcticus]MCW1923853.1 hypothetical protein [Luteolibacter arcticus]
MRINLPIPNARRKIIAKGSWGTRLSRKLTSGKPRGFALVVSLSLMALLLVLTVGLLSLSTLSLRTSGRESDARTARANARLALMLAIGDLQKELGPDRRITAPSGILSSGDDDAPALAHPQLTGVWDSREEALGKAPDYDREKPFRRWLVSSDDADPLGRTDFADKGSFKQPVKLVSGHGDREPVHAGGIDVTAEKGRSGRLAWWVGDENCKGFINPVSEIERKESPPTADVLAAAGTPGAYGVQAVESEFPSNKPEAAKVITSGQGDLAMASPNASEKHFHDLSPYPRSVLANVAKGALREDLSLFLEQSSFDRAPAWPSTTLNAPLGPNRKIALSDVNEYDVLSWKSLAHYSRLRNRVTLSNGRPTLTTFNGSSDVQPDEQVNQRWNSGTLRPAPVMVRCLLFISYGTKPDPADAQKLVVRFYAYPVMTLWNPYNVDLLVPEYNMLWTAMPMEHEIVVNGQVRGVFDWRNGGKGSAVRPILDKPLRLRAGEAKMLTPTRWNWFQAVSMHHAHYMDAVPFRYSPAFAGGEWGNGNGAGGSDALIQVSGVASDRVEVRTAVKLFENGGTAFAAGQGYQSTFDIRGNHCLESDGAWPTYLWSSKVAWRYQQGSPSPNKLSNDRAQTTFASLNGAPRPFMVMDAQLKALDEADLPNKTWADCIPGHSFQGATNSKGKTPFSASAYKLSLESINSYQEASSYLQVAPDDATHTYFGGSHFPQGGQSLITDIEIPMVPLTSLAQLQHLPQASIDNLYSSGFFMQNHAIGNSFASPGVPSNAVKSNRGWPFWVDMYMNNSGGTIRGEKFPKEAFLERSNIDRSYAANHLLWDDYFFSSMAPKDGLLRAAGDKAGIEATVREFYEEGKPLPNERYRPYLTRPAESVIAELVARDRPTTNGYKKAASSLMVEGGFNINSVSVAAWKTLLASAHRKRMGIMESMAGKPEVGPAGNFVVSRFSMPNGGSADAASGKAGDDLRWTGYRELKEEQIDALAQAIVRQVKARGPFRSLGEFINRRLGPESDERTLYGALQGALEDPAVNINEDFRSARITAADLADTDYANRSAAMGSRYQGAPAYVCQADLLGPIAPVLNARSDTFLVRGYGEATAGDGTVTARAWCEAVVQRVPDYLDATDLPEVAAASLRSEVNRSFGRRFNITSFRWLPAEEL